MGIGDDYEECGHQRENRILSHVNQCRIKCFSHHRGIWNLGICGSD